MAKHKTKDTITIERNDCLENNTTPFDNVSIMLGFISGVLQSKKLAQTH